MAKSADRKNVKHEPSQFTIEFSELYCNIIPNLYDLKCRKFMNDVAAAVKNIRQLKHDIGNWEGKQFFAKVSFEKPADRCAYMYAYSLINTSVVYCEFLRYLKENESLFLENFSVNTLRMCCLGGGPGIEAVAVSKAIHDAIWKSSSKVGSSFMNVHITVVDICSEWKSEESAVVNALNNTPDLFSSKRIHFHANFFEADLLKPFEETLQAIIKESDIITIIKFVNAVTESHPVDCTKELQNVVESVISCMEDNSCLFMLDTAGGNVFNSAMKVISKHKNVFKKQMTLHKAYRLHATPLQKLADTLNFRHVVKISTLLPTTLTRISSCIWVKKPVPVRKKKKKNVITIT